MMVHQEILGTITRRGRRCARPIAYLLIAALAVFGTIGVLADQAPATPPPGALSLTPLKGAVTAVSGSTLTVRQADGTTTSVSVNEKTNYMATVASTVSNIKVGDMVAVKGDKTADNTYHAIGLTIMGIPMAIHIGPGGKGPDVGVRSGTPAPCPTGAPTGAKCLEQSGSGGLAIFVGPKSGTPPAGLSPVTIAGGSPVTISGTAPAGAQRQVYVDTGNPVGTPPVLGKVTSVNGSTLTLQAPDNTTITVTTDARTAVQADQQSSLSAIKTGDTVMIGATKASDGSLTALFVHDGAPND